jgi:hypothetical protein
VDDLDPTMIVAMITMLMMQMISHQVIDMIAMRHLLVSAVCAVRVLRWVIATTVLGRATLGIAAVHLQRSIVEMIPMRDVHVAIVQVSGLLAMANRGVPAVAAVLVIVPLMPIIALHNFLPLLLWVLSDWFFLVRSHRHRRWTNGMSRNQRCASQADTERLAVDKDGAAGCEVGCRTRCVFR